MKPEPENTANVEEGSLIEQLTPGLTFQRVSHNKIMVFTFKDVSQATIGAWADRVIAEGATVKPGEVTYAMMDYSMCARFHLTPYFRQRSVELSKQLKDVSGYTAVVLPKTPLMQASVLLMRMLTIASQIRIFFVPQEALSWLKQNIDKLPPQ